jgi:hypothetical protein
MASGHRQESPDAPNGVMRLLTKVGNKAYGVLAFYVILLALAIALSCLLLPALIDTINALFPGAAEAHCSPADVSCKVDKILERLHPHQTLGEAVLKSLTVVVIAMLWFQAFKVVADLKRRHRKHRDNKPPRFHRLKHYLMVGSLICLSILPAGIFAVAMQDAYEPSVFVMALVAIFVAAEHYVGLKETEETVEHVISSVGILLNADGMARWKRQLYVEYRDSEYRIDAVVRHFDIDMLWWHCNGWADYLERAETNTETLLNVLTHSKAKVQFVADLPLPDLGGNGDQAVSFRNLLGLAWNLIVFAEAKQRRGGLPLNKADAYLAAPRRYLRIRISSAPAWMHVVDSSTYQVIEHGDLTLSSVRRLDSDRMSVAGRARLSDWGRRNIRQFAFRGSPGEEYLLSCMRAAALNIAPAKRDLLNVDIRGLLNALGMKDYLDGIVTDFIFVGASEKDVKDSDAATAGLARMSRDKAEVLCMKIFQVFLKKYCLAPCIKAGLFDAEKSDVSERDLAVRLV